MKEEATELARVEHEKGGHFHHDLIKIALLDRIHFSGLNHSIVTAIADCPRCKNFGGTHLHLLLQPITQRHPFKLLISDYLSMPPEKWGYNTIGLYLNTFTQHIWGYKFNSAGTGKTTVKSLDNIYGGFALAEVFMLDGGRHFKNNKVRQCCKKWGGQHHIVAAYLPWINGLVEGTNKILLYILACLCAPEVGEDGWQTTNWEEHGLITLTKPYRSSTGKFYLHSSFHPRSSFLALLSTQHPHLSRSAHHASSPRL
jgi:hypothetical protein